jgi:hypothetical protein
MVQAHLLSECPSVLYHGPREGLFNTQSIFRCGLLLCMAGFARSAGCGDVCGASGGYVLLSCLNLPAHQAGQ